MKTSQLNLIFNIPANVSLVDVIAAVNDGLASNAVEGELVSIMVTGGNSTEPQNDE